MLRFDHPPKRDFVRSPAAPIRKGIAANIISGTWILLLSLVAVPFQANLLGTEAYGLIIFAASLQVFMTILDLGLSTALVREIAADATSSRHNTQRLIQTLT